MTSPTARPVGRYRPTRRTATLVAGGVLLADQASKAAAQPLGRLTPRLVYPLTNHELSLGTVSAARWAEVAAMTVVLTAMAALCPALLRRAGVPAWALAAALAGAASNLVDRAVLGAVRDWLIVGPIVINVADVAVIVALLVVLRHLAASPRRQDAAP